jgi:hypothetical protein
MSELLRLIDEWKDAHGQPSDASISRAISGSDKTLHAWRKRGFKGMPDKATLRKLAAFLNVSYETVVLAAARDAGYLDDGPHEGDGGPGIANAV